MYPLNLHDRLRSCRSLYPNPAVVRRHQDVVLAGHLLDAGDLPALRVLAPGGPGVDHGVVLELVRAVEDAAAVVGADHGELAVLNEVGGGDEARVALHLVPLHHLLVRDVPQPQLAVQGGREEELRRERQRV